MKHLWQLVYSWISIRKYYEDIYMAKTKTKTKTKNKVIQVEDAYGCVTLPAKANDHAAGYDVHPIEVELVSHLGVSFICKTNEEIINACVQLKKFDKRTWWKRFKDWLNDEQPLKGWKQAKFNTGLKIAPEDIELYISLEPNSRVTKTDYVLHNSLGTIDNDYRGFSWAIYHSACQTYDSEGIIRLFDTCCQLKGKKSIPLEFVRKEKLSETARGEGGFGSTSNFTN